MPSTFTRGAIRPELQLSDTYNLIEYAGLSLKVLSTPAADIWYPTSNLNIAVSAVSDGTGPGLCFGYWQVSGGVHTPTIISPSIWSQSTGGGLSENPL